MEIVENYLPATYNGTEVGIDRGAVLPQIFFTGSTYAIFRQYSKHPDANSIFGNVMVSENAYLGDAYGQTSAGGDEAVVDARASRGHIGQTVAHESGHILLGGGHNTTAGSLMAAGDNPILLMYFLRSEKDRIFKYLEKDTP